MNILIKVFKAAATLTVFGITISAVWMTGGHVAAKQVAALEAQIASESVVVNPFEYETVLLAQALYGEARGHVPDWPHMATAVFARVGDPRWDSTVIDVLLTVRPNGRGCEIDAMCDQQMEDLTSVVGQQALVHAATALAAYYDGTFVPTHSGHSWATPEAAAGHAYFEGLMPVAQASGHIYFADAPMRPQRRPDCLAGCAPTTSPRPQPRPAQTDVDTSLAIIMASQ